MELLGLDIGTSHIKVVSIEKSKKNILKRFAISPSKDVLNKVLSDSEYDIDELAKFIKEFLLNEEIFSRKVVGVIPDNKVFTKLIQLPYVSGKEFDDAVKWEAEQHLPESLSDVYLKYTVLSDVSSKGGLIKKLMKSDSDNSEESDIVDVLLVAVSKRIVDKYLKLLNKAGLEPVGLEPSSASIVRSVVRDDTMNVPTIIADIGYSNVSFMLTLNKNVRFIRTVNFAISSLVNVISKELDVSPIKSAEYLYTYGMKENELDGKIKQIIKPVVDIILEELKKSIDFVQKKEELIGRSDNKQIKRIILNGGGALIPDLPLYIVQELSLEVEYAEPFKYVDISTIKGSEKLHDYGPLLSAAIGAAIKDIS